ncbi:Acetyltransferase (GNAT) family protein [Devosia enhydra]|uniref:Acetyltransferase (GNAT) family protein n=1 Tax=Devosia enhydra TaxID=665118 RepID=A0A1K2HUR5_9HYPH|nr:GNAT family N-acetyltransferase [Devosia enhydra]SFZ82077.1 Acetyltransferase (GNAT) family protein [Devosia enhydra]
MQISLTDAPEDKILKAIADGLTAFNEEDVGPSARRPLVVSITDDDGTILGGMSGYTAWGWLYIQWLWLDQSLRGQKLAGRILQMAEAEAVKRGCQAAFIDTFNPIALKAYQRQGYEIFGELPEFPKGRTRTFLKKFLPPA